MKLIVLGTLVGHAVLSPPAPSGLGVGVQLLVALLAGGGAGVFYNFWRQRKVGDAERQSLFGEATAKAVSAAETMLVRYEHELERVEMQLRDLTAALGRSNERIASLEKALEVSNGDRDRLAGELARAIEQRTVALMKMEELHRRVAELEALVPKH